MFPRNNESFGSGEFVQNQNVQQQSSEFIHRERDYDRFQSSNNRMPLFQPPATPYQDFVAVDRDHPRHHSSVPPPGLDHPPPLHGRYDNTENHEWTAPDSTCQSYDQNVFPPVHSSNLMNANPNPPLSIYPTTDTTPRPGAPLPVDAHSSGSQPNTMLSNPACPPFQQSAVLPSQSDLHNAIPRNQTNAHVQQQQPDSTTMRIMDSHLNVRPTSSIPSPQDMRNVPPPNFNIPPSFFPPLNINNNLTTQQHQSYEDVDKYEKDEDEDELVAIQRQNDQFWIDERFFKNFRTHLRTITKANKKKSIDISEARKLIRDMLMLVDQIQQKTKHLELIMATAAKENWVKEVKNIESMKKQLERLRIKMDNKELLTQLEMKVKKIQKNRKRLKRSRSRGYQEKQEAITRRNEIDCRINAWRDAISQKEAQYKKDKEMKICVDSVLGEVKKKESDVYKMLELIKTLTKLRKIRKDKGVYTLFHCDQKFEKDVPLLQNMLNHQLEIYKAEHRTLEVMLECEQEETKERERARSKKVQAEINKREHRREQVLLFGKRTIDDDDQLYPFMKFYSQAEDNWETFIQIRREWDNFLVPEDTPGASRLPNCWVMPPQPSDNLWAKFLLS